MNQIFPIPQYIVSPSKKVFWHRSSGAEHRWLEEYERMILKIPGYSFLTIFRLYYFFSLQPKSWKLNKIANVLTVFLNFSFNLYSFSKTELLKNQLVVRICDFKFAFLVIFHKIYTYFKYIKNQSWILIDFDSSNLIELSSPGKSQRSFLVFFLLKHNFVFLLELKVLMFWWQFPPSCRHFFLIDIFVIAGMLDTSFLKKNN